MTRSFARPMRVSTEMSVGLRDSSRRLGERSRRLDPMLGCWNVSRRTSRPPSYIATPGHSVGSAVAPSSFPGRAGALLVTARVPNEKGPR